VEAQARLGYSVNGYGVGRSGMQRKSRFRLGDRPAGGRIRRAYDVAAPLRPGGARRAALREAAGIELGLRAFLENAISAPSPTRFRISTGSSNCLGSRSNA